VPCVLIVEDEPDLVLVLEFNFAQAGFETLCAHGGEEALLKLRQRVPDLILLDLMLPDVAGTEVFRKMKGNPKTQDVPVIIVTAKGDELDRVVGLELGADDYVTKPFSVREVILRARAVLKRGQRPPTPGARESIGPIRLDVDGHRCFVGGQEVELTAIEFKLLTRFMACAGRIMTRDALLEGVWGQLSLDLQERTVDSHVKRLRAKLREGEGLIETVRGVGYRMLDPAA
jgi:two-component system, OmpR family, phosphate regulon response regulator PhoB